MLAYSQRRMIKNVEKFNSRGDPSGWQRGKIELNQRVNASKHMRHAFCFMRVKVAHGAARKRRAKAACHGAVARER